jgi:hypothetical protein
MKVYAVLSHSKTISDTNYNTLSIWATKEEALQEKSFLQQQECNKNLNFDVQSFELHGNLQLFPVLVENENTKVNYIDSIWTNEEEADKRVSLIDNFDVWNDASLTALLLDKVNLDFSYWIEERTDFKK